MSRLIITASYFYPRPPGGGRRFWVCRTFVCVQFLSTPSGWRATQVTGVDNIGVIFLSTPSGWRATLLGLPDVRMCPISIHALRVEGDARNRGKTRSLPAFLSTPSGWRATANATRVTTLSPKFLSTPSGWRATWRLLTPYEQLVFLSTPSGWRATKRDSICERGHAISIHALRVEGDQLFNGGTFGGWDFYPRPPGGGRQ